jgi:simple sugar transport system permease protein
VTTEGPVGAPERPEEESAAPQQPAPDEKPGRHDSFASVFAHNLWSANTVTVTILSILLAMVIGAILIIVSDPDVLATFSYFTARPSDAINASWVVVSTAYGDLFRGAVFDPAAVTAWLNGSGTWQAAFTPISETLTYAAPLVFTGLSVALAFRGGLFNIGGQGQAVIGCICAAVAGFSLPLPIVLNLLVALIAGLAGGAFWGFFSGLL